MKRLLVLLFVLGVGFADNNVSPNTKVLEKGSIEWYQKNLAEAKNEFDRNGARSMIALLEERQLKKEEQLKKEVERKGDNPFVILFFGIITLIACGVYMYTQLGIFNFARKMNKRY